MAILGKKSLRIGAIVVVLVLATLVWGNYQVKKALKLAFANKILLLNKSQPLEFSYENIAISIWDKSFKINDVLILPDANTTDDKVNSHVSISSLEVDDFKIFPLLLRKHLLIDDLNVSGLEVVYKKSEPIRNKDSINQTKQMGRKKNALKRLSVANFQVIDYQMFLLDKDSRDTINSLIGEKLLIEHIELLKDTGEDGVLSLNSENMVFKLTDQTLSMGKDASVVSIDSLTFTPKQGNLKLSGLKVGDENKSRELVQLQEYNTPVSFYSVPYSEVFGIRTDSFFSKAAFFADSLWVQDASFTIIKDLQKPWNEEKTIPIPPQILRRERRKFWLHKIQITNAHINYVEIMDEKVIDIPVDDLNATVLNVGTITSNYESIQDHAMKVRLQGTVLKKVDFESNFEFINPMTSNFFHFNGKTSSFSFESLNPVMVPSTSIKFESGNVHQIVFSGEGNEEMTKGELVMRFNDLKSSVLRKHSGERNKTFSWLANTAVRTENPRNGKLKTAQINYKRVPFKGFGNYMVKTVESGLINSVYPFGRRKTEK